MKISGFTIARNTTKYYFPIKESILSILPIVDEYIVALGDSDEGDRTEDIIRSINSSKIKIYKRTWDKQLYVDGEIYRHETDFALSKCTGDWCFYLQGDEVVHEKDLNKITDYCRKYLGDKRAEGLLFNYIHFWGDYDHYIDTHGWVKNEIRIIRKDIGIYSYKDAASFRLEKDKRLRVIKTPVKIYHYGWVRPPELMVSKKKEMDSMYWGIEKANEVYKKKNVFFEYGPLGLLSVYKESHPKTMAAWIKKFNWKDKLDYSKKLRVQRKLVKHEKIKYKFLTFIEKKLLGGKEIFGYSSGNIIKHEK